MPRQATFHRLAAVVRPDTFFCAMKMVPAPKADAADNLGGHAAQAEAQLQPMAGGAHAGAHERTLQQRDGGRAQAHQHMGAHTGRAVLVLALEANQTR